MRSESLSPERVSGEASAIDRLRGFVLAYYDVCRPPRPPTMVEFAQHLLTAQHQGVQMIALRHGFMHDGLRFDMVAIEHCHFIKKIREHAPGHESGDAATYNDGMFPQAIGHQAFAL